MQTRQFVWSDERVQRLARNFVPAADEVYRLQSGTGRECELFQKIAAQGHYAGSTDPSESQQGMYAATTDGRLLASVNSNNPRRVEEMLLTALRRLESPAATDASPSPARIPAANSPLSRRWESRVPTDGLILRVVSRDLPRQEPEPSHDRRRWRNWHRQAWNMDYAWFQRDEMLSLLPRRRKVGSSTVVPRRLVERLARLHLVDNVRGQVDAFARGDIRHVELHSRITKMGDDRIVLVLEGGARVVHPRSAPVDEPDDRRHPERQERGVETTLLGTAEFDTRLNQFVRFDLVAIGTRWGGSRFNARERDLEPNGIGFAFTLATEDAPVAPAFIWEYDWN